MIPWRKKWQPSPEFLPEKSCGQRSLAGYSQRDHKEPNLTEQISMHDILYNKSLFFIKVTKELQFRNFLLFVYTQSISLSLCKSRYCFPLLLPNLVSMHAKSFQSCPVQTLCNSMDCSPPGFSVHGLLQDPYMTSYKG